MKWENRDSNNVEQANTLKFIKLDYIVTFLRLHELFFDDAVDMIIVYTKLFSLREKTDISFEIINDKICLFLSMLLFSGSHNFQTVKYIGRQPPIFLLCQQGLIQCLVICLSIFFGVSIFVTMNNLINNTNSRSSFARLIGQIGEF